MVFEDPVAWFSYAILANIDNSLKNRTVGIKSRITIFHYLLKRIYLLPGYSWVNSGPLSREQPD